jgi:peroxin-1
VLATARGAARVAAELLRAGALDARFEVPALDRAGRAAVLAARLAAGPGRPRAAAALAATAAGRLEGFTGRDIETLARRAARAAAGRALRALAARGAAEAPEVSEADVAAGLEGFVPAALRGVQAPAATEWEAVGGLEAAKAELLTAVELPTRHPDVFGAAPLRVRSGALLFGHPGSGKTLLVSALGARCGLAFLSVKGPELLNKYIGQSEAGVRDVFARAAAAAPCILFFDEFESLAPRRGADSTGVTDRVVRPPPLPPSAPFSRPACSSAQRIIAPRRNHESLHAVAQSRECRASWFPLVAADARARRRPFKPAFKTTPPRPRR